LSKNLEIKYEISRFPDGQQQVKILSCKDLFEDEDYQYGEPHLRTDVQIKARLNNFKDLELIICATKSLRELGIQNINLYTPYFLGSRSDRKFEEGSNNYLKDVICPIINSLNFDSVTVLDPHSDVLEACLNNFNKNSNLDLIKFSLSSMLKLSEDTGKFYDDDFILVSPDSGANKKIFKVAEQIGYKGDIITCSKSRDEHGQLSKVNVPYEFTGKDLIIIDDICDGGATFINIAKTIRDRVHNSVEQPKIYLIITHGIFSKGLKELNKYFDGIYCTNSYVDMNDDNFSLVNDNQLHKLKQLNIF